MRKERLHSDEPVIADGEADRLGDAVVVGRADRACRPLPEKGQISGGEDSHRAASVMRCKVGRQCGRLLRLLNGVHPLILQQHNSTNT